MFFEHRETPGRMSQPVRMPGKNTLFVKEEMEMMTTMTKLV
jgi:hypothetical protein